MLSFKNISIFEKISLSIQPKPVEKATNSHYISPISTISAISTVSNKLSAIVAPEPAPKKLTAVSVFADFTAMPAKILQTAPTFTPPVLSAKSSLAIDFAIKPKVLFPITNDFAKLKPSPIADIIDNIFRQHKKIIFFQPEAPLVTVTEVKPRSSRAGDVNTLLDKFKESKAKYTAYESITGISSQRPELILLSEFKPLFNENFKNQSKNQYSGQNLNGLNDYGDFIDIQMQVQNLHHYNIVKTIKEIKNADEDTKKKIDLRTSQFMSTVQSTVKNIDYLYNLVRQLEDSKDSFNLKSDKFDINWSMLVRNYYSDRATAFSSYINSSRNFSNTTTPSKFITKFGYQDSGVAKFSSTKLYLQLLNEFRNLVGNFSVRLLGKAANRQKNDTSAIAINTNLTAGTFFDISAAVSELSSPLYSDIEKLNARSIGEAVKSLSSFFDKLNGIFVFSSAEDKIAFYTHYISKEYRYSSALSKKDNQDFIATNYGYQFNSQGANFNLFDFVIGRTGDKITQVFSSPNENSLAASAHILQDNSLVLPFEEKYLDLDASIFIPGTDFFINSIFDKTTNNTAAGTVFDTTNLQKYADTMNQTAGRFAEFVNRMQFFSMFSHYEEIRTVAYLASPRQIIDELYSNILETRRIAKADFANDPMTALINLAYKDNILKSLLYAYIIISNTDIAPAGSDTQNTQPDQSAIEEIIKQIRNRVENLVPIKLNSAEENIADRFIEFSNLFMPYFPNQDLKVDLISNKIVFETIANNLRKGSPAINFLKTQFANILSIFRNSKSLIQSRTLYSDISDSTLTAIIFDLCLAAIDKHVNTRFVNRLVTADQSNIGQQLYVIENKQVDTGESAKLVISKIDDEADLILQSILAITAIQRRIVELSTSTLSSLQKEDTANVLNSIASAVGSQKYLSHLMTEQQLILAKSLTEQVNAKLVSAAQSSDDLVVFDDTPTLENMKNAFFAFFSQDRLCTRKSLNSRIITVGIPNGFARSIRNKISAELLDRSYNKKQTDIVSLNVYKVDVDMQDIIFLPQKFMFELSRFVLNSENEVKSVGIDSSVEQVNAAVSTRDYSLDAGKVAANSAIFDNPLYSFLTDKQKAQLISNHVANHFIEMYIRYLTGMRISESNFEFIINEQDKLSVQKSIDDEFIKTLIASSVFRRIPAAGIGNHDDTKKTLEENSDHRSDMLIYRDVKSITNLANVSTTISNPAYEASRMLRPKEFERIFSVIVDPNDYEIDVVATQKTVLGSSALEKLVKQGLVISVDENTAVTADQSIQNKRVKVIERNTSDNNLVFEKYFVEFETVIPGPDRKPALTIVGR